MMTLSTMQQFAIWVLPIVFAITVHESAHAFAAHYFGDNTAKLQGRLSLNPIKHIDWLGTILVPAIMVIFTGFAFGWAKPVPIDWRNLKNPKTNMIWIAFAGPFSNLVMGIMWAIVLRVSLLSNIEHNGVLFIIFTAVAGIMINTILMVLNLLPLPPLDGSRILSGLLPSRLAIAYNKIEPYGFFIIMGLMMLGFLGIILNPFINLVLSFLAEVSGVSPGLMYGFLETIR
ncbi:MAG: site-2 protease family protein [Pseudomonadota bacterium]